MYALIPCLCVFSRTLLLQLSAFLLNNYVLQFNWIILIFLLNVCDTVTLISICYHCSSHFYMKESPSLYNSLQLQPICINLSYTEKQNQQEINVIYHEEWIHGILEAEKSHDLQLANWRLWRADGVSSSMSAEDQSPSSKIGKE